MVPLFRIAVSMASVRWWTSRRLVHCMPLMLAVTLTSPAVAALPSPAVIAETASQLHPAGQGLLRFLGLRIYEARLWVGPDFEPARFAAGPLALELTYFRDFSASAIAERSVKEIHRQVELTPEQAATWTRVLTDWLPDVQAGDVLSSVYLPGQGMQLWQADQVLGFLPDPDLAEYFFGIWLSPDTSEPSLRQALLRGAGGSEP